LRDSIFWSANTRLKFKNRLILLIYFIERTDGAKVFSREGNSPDHLLKFLNTAKLKDWLQTI